MVIRRLLLAVALCLLLSGMRDPFQPPAQPCQGTQAGGWHYHGMVAGGQTIGFLRDADGGWHRAVAGERLASGWRVESVQAHEIIIALAKECRPAQWRLKREGAQNEKLDSVAGAQQPVGGSGASGEPRHADVG